MTQQTNDITREDVEHLALLSRITITESDVKGFHRDLKNILQHVKEVQSVNTENTEETNQVTGLSNVTRKDTSYPSGIEKELLHNAGTGEGQHIRVHSIIS